MNGNPIAVNTTIPEVSPGVYQLEFYTLPAIPASVTVSNGVSTEDFTTASCNQCTSTIPTMSEWGLMIFALLTMNLGLITLRRKEEMIVRG